MEEPLTSFDLGLETRTSTLRRINLVCCQRNENPPPAPEPLARGSNNNIFTYDSPTFSNVASLKNNE
jgi:hypothetical protein